MQKQNKKLCIITDYEDKVTVKNHEYRLFKVEIIRTNKKASIPVFDSDVYKDIKIGDEKYVFRNEKGYWRFVSA